MTKRTLPVVEDQIATMKAQRASSLRLIAGERTPALPGLLAEDAFSRAESLTHEAKKRRPPAREVACRPGCAFCCYIKVVVSPVEVLRIVEYLRQSLGAEELRALRERVQAADERTRGLALDERSQLQMPCPLLREGTCTVYPARPLACRGWHSFDAAACERIFNDTELQHSDEMDVYGPQVQIPREIQGGLIAALERSGLQGDRLELNAALRIALEREEIAERWLRGRRPFAPATDAETAANTAEVLEVMASIPDD